MRKSTWSSFLVASALLMTATVTGSAVASAGSKVPHKSVAPVNLSFYYAGTPGGFNASTLLVGVLLSYPKFFKDAGLNVSPVPAGIDSIPTLLDAPGGTLVIGTGTATIASAIVIHPSDPERVIAILANYPTFTLNTQKSITNVHQLIGKTIGVPGIHAAGADELRASMAAAGIPSSEYSISVVSNGAPAFAALESGSIAAYTFSPPGSYVAAGLGFPKLFSMVKYVKNQYMEGAIAVNEPWARANRTTVVRFLEAYLKAMQFLTNSANRSAVFKMLANPAIFNSTGGKPLTAGEIRAFYGQVIATGDLAFKGVPTSASHVTGTWAAMENDGIAKSLTTPSPSNIFDWSYVRAALHNLGETAPKFLSSY